MSSTARRSRSGTPAQAPAPARRSRAASNVPNNLSVKINVVYRDITELKMYDYNPRDNAGAIDSVANSIRTFGFLIPIVIDADDCIICGHTRVAAAGTKLGMTEVPTITATHLSEEQINAFRLIDNKVAEIAKWDFDLLSGEIAKLSDSGIELTDFGWSREELDCLTDMVRDDCLSAENLIDNQSRENIRRAERRAPSTARMVLGELVFFIPATDYRAWIDGIRSLHDYNEADMIADVKRRLGMNNAQ